MNRVAVSVFAWGLYLIGAGLGFLFVPAPLLSLFRFSPAPEGWIRIIGLLVAILGVYYVYCALKNDITFIRITAYGRVAFALGSLVLVILKLVEPPMLLIGGLDALGATWTFLSLRAVTETKSVVAGV
jgi:hypothetical protein